jgi:hypothetical protein
MKKIKLFLLLVYPIFLACSDGQTTDNQLSKKEKEENWQLLFDGKTTNGWHLYNKGNTPSAWMVSNGELVCNPDTFEVEHGDLVSDKKYQNFELIFDWKISEAGNSGVFINVIENDTIPRAWASGPEFQLLDHQGIGQEYLKDSTKWAGCLYGFKPQENKSIPNPAGVWNKSKIIQSDGKISFYLNDILTASQDFKAEDWKMRILNSNFKYFPVFGKSISGHIVLQDWSKGVSFKNIKIKEL